MLINFLLTVKAREALQLNRQGDLPIVQTLVPAQCPLFTFSVPWFALCIGHCVTIST